MHTILTWMKEFMIIYLVLAILAQLAATDKYKKYLHFYSCMILLMVLLSPVLKVLGKEGELEGHISYEAFWEQLDSIRQDTRKMDFLQGDRYIQKYEAAIAEDIEGQIQAQGASAREIRVTLTSGYEIGKIEIWLEQQSKDGEGAPEQIRRFLMEIYGAKEGQIQIYTG